MAYFCQVLRSWERTATAGCSQLSDLLNLKLPIGVNMPGIPDIAPAKHVKPGQNKVTPQRL